MRGGRKVLHDFSLTIRPGEHTVILGPNGSGKSTFIKLITRELYPMAGKKSTFRIFGETSWDVTELRARLGIVSTDARAFTERQVAGEEAVLSGFFSSVGIWPHHRVSTPMRQKTRQVLRFLGVSALAERSMAQMSSGETQRFLIGRALVHDPEALVLDEPTNSLDFHAAREFRQTLSKIARSGPTIILVTHHAEDVIPEIRNVILLRQGKIFRQGTKSHMINSKNLSALFGCKIRFRAHSSIG